MIVYPRHLPTSGQHGPAPSGQQRTPRTVCDPHRKTRQSDRLAHTSIGNCGVMRAAHMSARSFLLGCAVGYIMQLALEYSESVGSETEPPKRMNPLARLVESLQTRSEEEAGGAPVGVRDLVVSLAAQQLHHVRALQAGIFSSISGPLRYRYEVAWLALRTALTVPVLKLLSALARAVLRRISLGRPRLRSWLNEANRGLLGSPWLGFLLTFSIVVTAALVVAPTDAPAARSPTADAAAAVQAVVSVNRNLWQRLPSCRIANWKTLHCGFTALPPPSPLSVLHELESALSDEGGWWRRSAGAPLASLLYRAADEILHGARATAASVHAAAANALHPLRFALVGLGLQAGLASLMALAIVVRLLLVERETTNYAAAAADAARYKLRRPSPLAAAETRATQPEAAMHGTLQTAPAPGAATSAAAAATTRSSSPIPRSASLSDRLLDLAVDMRELRARGWLQRLRFVGAASHLVLCIVPVWQLLLLYYELSSEPDAAGGAGGMAPEGGLLMPGVGRLLLPRQPPPDDVGADAAARGFRALTALCFLLWLQTVGRTCWLLLSLALVRDDKFETSFAQSMEWTCIAPRFERLLSALTRGLAIFPPR